ncbi:hypothetical protein DCC85_06965 [Paenibacillus sp. CAA11]|uniref:DUF2161 family putative PD-(D/E)XK-type phosphodiesterase n=1 Tax=Paenibacillus sp. CAA11 TaxID=1532905 RepID=UPI000D34B607|nr:DUF2161 family putative PD-(D/E)XK-type phosphodiesterase [Paenibacillus sp. CAA11]AWB43987.1 hypothetical protein DCC85_06965 [Paenibacillus sp. CAA11]
MAVQHETELYLPLKQFFERRGYEIKGEVKHCDLVGFKPGADEPLVVEIKKTFNLALLLQGQQRQRLTSQVYLAVERNRAKKGAHNQRWREIAQLCTRLGLGLITITVYKTKPAFVEVLCSPAEPADGTPLPKPIKHRVNRLAHEFRERSGDYNVGGSNGRKLVTAYREKTLLVADALRGGIDLSPREIKAHSGVGNAASILQRNFYGWFRRISRGRYILTEEGRQALIEYAELLESRKLAAAGLAPECDN